MKEAAATLESLGMKPILSTAIAELIGSAHAKFKESGLAFDKEYPEMLAALAADDKAGDKEA